MLFVSCFGNWSPHVYLWPAHHMIKTEIRLILLKFLFWMCLFLALFFLFSGSINSKFVIECNTTSCDLIDRCSRWYICSLWGLPTIIIIIAFLDGCVQKGVRLYSNIKTHWCKNFHSFLGNSLDKLCIVTWLVTWLIRQVCYNVAHISSDAIPNSVNELKQFFINLLLFSAE